MDSAYVTGCIRERNISNIEKLISTVGNFLSTFCYLINCMSWMFELCNVFQSCPED